MYRFKTLTGNCLWARPHIDSQATEVAVRVGMSSTALADLARPQSVRIA
ncbi:MAG: hypothetical protein E5299_01614 [Burkholderia gladioli]|nr:MAG: hypothetical protein E5299_01614 [Burkholderia gladioli]